MRDFYARMMNIQGKPASMIVGSVQSWNEGHKDARHEAALIALEADAEIRRLRAKVAKADALADACYSASKWLITFGANPEHYRKAHKKLTSAEDAYREADT